MSRRASIRSRWEAGRVKRLQMGRLRSTASALPLWRRLRFEPLEERRLLATVNALHDVSLADAETTLREAILAASPGETIDFAAALTEDGPATIQLSNAGQLSINKNLTIQGPGAHLLTIKAFDPDADGSNDGDGSRVFYINAAGLANVTISGVTLTNGDVNASGGAIFNAENLTIRDSVITGNSGTHVASRGGGIAHFFGTLTIERSTISDNYARVFGGGVFADHATAVHVTESTISGNQAAAGGGIYGYYSYNMNVVGSTISGNRAFLGAGGIGLFYSTLSARHSTITANRADSDGNGTGSGGGVVVAQASNLNLFHTIVAGNLRNTGMAAARSDIAGTVSAQFSLIGDSTGATVSNVGGTSLVGTGAAPIDALLGPLGPNGGRTQTHALLTGSPAIDSGQLGIVSPPANDQRGAPFVRIFDGDGVAGGRIDIGAYERQTLAGLNLVVDEVVDENDGDYSLGDLSLREAIGLANGSAGADTISFDAALYAIKIAKIFLTQGELVINDSLTINGPGSDNLLIDASRVDPTPYMRNGDGIRVFRIDDGALGTFIDVEFIGVDIRGGDVVGRGGAIWSFENLTITDCEIISNHATHGGGIHAEFGELNIAGSAITGNTAANRGGGLNVYYAPTTITDSTIRENTAGGRGGGAISYVSFTITRSTVTGNEADNGGGVAGNLLFINDSTISENFADTDGGGVRNAGTLTVMRITISGNVADDGGGIFTSGDGNTTISDSTIHGNFAVFGGGISHNTGNLTVTSSLISGNSANQGGGILSETAYGYEADIVNTTFSENSATLVGGAIVNGSGTLRIRHCTITASLGAGGGVASRGNNGTETFVYSSIIVNFGGPDVQFFDGSHNSFTSQGYNLVGFGNAAMAPTNAFIAPGDQIGVDPMLGALLDNGGVTKTYKLLMGSPAIDAGDPFAQPDGINVPFFDQRGFLFVRVFDGDGIGGPRMDIGAYERQTVENLTLVVDTLVDESDGNYGSGDMSLREAIGISNGSIGPNSISFASALTSGGPATILLTQGELQSRETLTLTGPGAAKLTIDASGSDPTPDENNRDGSRIFDVDDDEFGSGTGAFTISGLTLTGGDPEQDGGAIQSEEEIVISDCVIIGNAADDGGGIMMDGGNLTMTNCLVIGNVSADDGGGLLIEDDTAIITASVIEGNIAGGRGGGILSGERLELIASTVSGNTAAFGGGVLSVTRLNYPEYTKITNSTISGNTATVRGGGVYNSQGATIIRFSTITDNNSPAGTGSGVASRGDFLTDTDIHSSIIAGNDNSDVDFVNGGANSFDSLGHNLVGGGNATMSPLNAFNQMGDQIGANPMLGGLAANGGPTMTHALLVGSPAINTGDINAMAGAGGVPEFDQRGAPFLRVTGGRIDKGAVERQPIPSAVFGDYNEDGTVNAADYTVWRNASGQMGVTPYSGADGNGDGKIDRDDFLVWKDHYGQMLPGSGAGVESIVAEDQPQGLISLSTAAPKRYPASSGSQAGTSLAKPVALIPIRVGTFLPEASPIAELGRHPLVSLLARADRSTVAAARDEALLEWFETPRVLGSADDHGAGEFAVVSKSGDERRDSLNEAFDAKINWLVYELYGLTEEEIALVEGAAGKSE